MEIEGATAAQLRGRARELKIKGYSKMNKAGLRAALKRRTGPKRVPRSKCRDGDTLEDLRRRAKLVGIEAHLGMRVTDLDREVLCSYLYGLKSKSGRYRKPSYHRASLRPVASPGTAFPTKGIIQRLPDDIADSVVISWMPDVISRHPTLCSMKNVVAEWNANADPDAIVVFLLGNRVKRTNQSMSLLEGWLTLFLDDCKKSGAAFAALPLSLYADNAGHSNMLLFDLRRGSMERFEPHGGKDLYTLFGKKSLRMNEALEKMAKALGYRYLLPQQSACPRIPPAAGPQTGDDWVGYCLAWSFMYLETRLNNPGASPRQVNDFLLNETRKYGQERMHLTIWNYYCRMVRSVYPNWRCREPRATQGPKVGDDI